MTHDYRKYLRPEEISRIARLEVQARHIVEGFLSGSHRSPYLGQSVEFAQHREYAPGDDIRRIDWKVWAKTDRYYLKQYEEETNLRCTLLVDGSESMQFGSGRISKFEYACSLAAALAYLMLRQQDAVGLVTFDQSIRAQVPTSSRKNHLHSILAALAVEEPRQKTGLYDVLFEIARTRPKPGMVMLISDLFVDRDDLFRGLRLLRHRGHDVLIFHVLDDQELDFDYRGTTRFEGLEETGQLICDPRALREGYLQAVQRFLAEIRQRCSRNVIDYQTIRTSQHLDAVLAHYMNHRIGMRKTARK